MRETPVCTAADAIYKLAAGNLKYLNADNGSGDISRRIRMSTLETIVFLRDYGGNFNLRWLIIMVGWIL